MNTVLGKTGYSRNEGSVLLTLPTDGFVKRVIGLCIKGIARKRHSRKASRGYGVC